MVIGLTGGIATGKTTAANHLAGLGAVIIDADKLAREIVLPGSLALKEIETAFGGQVIQEDGFLDRKALGEIIFSDQIQREHLNNIMIPKIIARAEELIEHHRRAGISAVVIDAPLLFEVGMNDIVDSVWVVYVPRDAQIHRLMARDGLTEFQAKERLAAQISIEEKRLLADNVIDNSSNMAHTFQQIEELWQQLQHRI
ncbi:MAG: dephospho-CoA kinase [Clostridia bacterium]|nr:dephospho-CoA kinase [Clostridia bacterium]